jgi:hypothetical protein
MNKKIKIIELLNKIANGEDVPSNIKVEDKEYCLDGSTYYTVGEDDEDLFCLESYTSILDFLKLEVEILEDNTEEIEELDKFDIQGLEVSGYSMTQAEYLLEDGIEENRQKINELVKAVNQIRKDLNNDN